MSIFEVEANGKTYEVEAPSMDAAMSVFQGGSTEQQKPSMMADIAKSFGSGLVQGATGLVELPGAVSDLIGAGMDYVLPLDKEKRQKAEAAGIRPGALLPRPGEATAFVERNVTGELHKPETMAGEYARTFGEFAPTALMGPGGAIRKTAMATIPAVTSETAGQLTKGTAAEPWARAGGAVTGGLAASMGGAAKAATKEAAKGAPTAESLKQQTDALYGQLRNAGVQYDTSAFSQTIADMRRSLPGKGKLPSVTSKAHDFVDDLERAAVNSLDFDDVNEIRRVAGETARGAARTGDESLSRAFNIIVDKIDDFEKNAPLLGNPSLNQTQLNALRQEARTTALQNIKQRALGDVLEKAETYQGGFEAGVRNQVSALLRSNKGMQLFKDGERAALMEVAKGRKPLQTLSRFGFDLTSLSGNASFLPALGAIGGALAGGPLTGGALAAAGTAAKVASPMLTKRSFDTAASAIRSGQLTGPQAGLNLQRLQFEEMLRRLQVGGITGLAATP
jgi:hypothetical protein